MRTCVIDIETSGLVPKNATYELDFLKFPRILSIAYKINQEEVKEFIVCNNGFSIPIEATKINGITNEMCKSSPYQLEGLLIELFDQEPCDFIIGHNLYFDTSIIKANILRLISEERINQVVFDNATKFLDKEKRIDTMRAGTKFCGKWPKLTELYFKLFGELYPAHSAGSDVEACYKSYVKMVEMGLIVHPTPTIGMEL